MVSDRWVQVSCSLFPTASGGPHIPWQSINRAFGEWRRAGLAKRCWYVRKMPGLRLRVEATDDGAALIAAMVEWLGNAERRNDIRGYRRTVYEAETHRFGGDSGMDLAHHCFSTGTQIALDALTDDDLSTEERAVLSILATADLAMRTLDDPAEVWDVWMRLRRALAAPTQSGAREPSRVLAAAIRSPAAGWPRPTDRYESRIQEANAHVASRLRALTEAGELSVGPRAWITAATLFEWNRLGLPEEPQLLHALLLQAAAAFEPGERTQTRMPTQSPGRAGDD